MEDPIIIDQNVLTAEKPLGKVSIPIIIGIAATVVIAGVLLAFAVERRTVAIRDTEVSNDSFDFRFFSQTASQEKGKNFMVSPLSLEQALAMAYNGAGGTTKSAMAKTLGVTQADLTAYNVSNQQKIAALGASDPSVSLNIANSLWARQGLTFDNAFLQRSATYYNAKASTLDFNDPAASDVINGWVNAQTNGKIPTIVDKNLGDSVMYLINAVYFKGNWLTPFSPDNTANRDFTTSDKSKLSVPSMSTRNDFPYYENGDLQMVSLPYGNTGNISMDLILPKPGRGLDGLFTQLHTDTWQSWLNQFSSSSVQVYLPKFTAEYSSDLNSTLINMGMGVAFSPSQADFSGMDSQQGLYISKVLQKTFVKVDERGTEAAAVTSLGMATLGMIRETPAPSHTIDINRPFFYAIRDKTTNSILFMGVTNDPR